MIERLLVDLRSDGRVQVSSWPAAEQFPRPVGDPVELVWPLSDEDLADLRWYLERYLRLPTAVYGERGARVAAALPRWGEQIFTAVFGPGPARDAYVAARARGGPTEIVLLSKSAEQMGHPWELMSDPGRGVPVVLDGVAVSRSLQNAGMGQVFAVPGTRLRVLMVISRPDGTADVGYQMIARPLLQQLEAVRGNVELVVLRPPTLQRLNRVLAEAREAGKPFQVVHFDGHGVFGQMPATGAGSTWGSAMYEAPGPQGMLAFERPGGGSDLVAAEPVARVLAGAHVPVVVLNACQSAQVGSQLEAAVATRLLADGCASVVAMAYSVYAVAAAEFMTTFYERLFAGDRVADAVTAGRRQLVLSNKRPSMKGMLPLADWMVPVLYTRTDLRFPELRTTRSPGEAVGEVLAQFSNDVSGLAPQGGQEDDLTAPSRFVGRDSDLYTLDIAARLRHVVIVHGPGGTGKTELAKAFGRWWRDTGGVDNPEWVLWHSFQPGVASAGLDGVINRIGQKVFDIRFNSWDDGRRQAEVEKLLTTRRLLLIWDNFETVREMPAPGQATPPLPTNEQDRIRAFLARVANGGRSAVVITSRSPESWLGTKARRIELGGLNNEDAAAYADHLLAEYPDARRHQQSPEFATLMQWLDGHPLSMCLTLPHLETSTAQHLLESLQSALPLPTKHGGGGRHSSLAACIAYSFEHLSPQDQQALTVLSLFHGVALTVTLTMFSEQPEAPRQFRDRTAAQWGEALQRAANLGLLTPLGGGVFRLHPALPAHLAAQWRAHSPDTHAAERAAAAGALIAAHGVLAFWLDEQTRGGDARLAFALIELQQRMLGAMLGLALERGQWADANFILRPLSTYWEARGLVSEARSWLDRVRLAVEAPDGTPPDLNCRAGDLWCLAATSQAAQELRNRRFDRADQTYRTILGSLLKQPVTDDQLSRMAATYYRLGSVALHKGLLEEAAEWYRKALAINEDLGRRPSMAACYGELGTVARQRGLLEEAEKWYRRSHIIKEELGDRPGLAASCHALGTVAQARKLLEEAEEWYRRSLTINKELGNRPGRAMNYAQLGTVARQRGRLEEAEEWYRRSLTIKEELGDRPGLAETYRDIAEIAKGQGLLGEAESWYRRSLTINEELGNRSGMANACYELGEIALGRGLLEDAEQWCRQSLTIYEEVGDSLDMAAFCYFQLGMIARQRGRLEEAEEWFCQSLPFVEESGDRSAMAATYGLLGTLATAREDTGQAVTWMVKCVSLFDEIPHPATEHTLDRLRRLSARAGVHAVETAWQDITGEPLPANVREFLTAATETD